MSDFEDLLSRELNIEVFSYSSKVTDEVWAVIKLIHDEHPIHCNDIALRLGLSASYVELIQYLLCNNDNAEYGTSPRGCWLTKKGERLFDALVILRDSPH